jgi:hypothetical protein
VVKIHYGIVDVVIKFMNMMKVGYHHWKKAIPEMKDELYDPKPISTRFISTKQDVYRKYKTAKRNESQF